MEEGMARKWEMDDYESNMLDPSGKSIKRGDATRAKIADRNGAALPDWVVFHNKHVIHDETFKRLVSQWRMQTRPEQNKRDTGMKKHPHANAVFCSRERRCDSRTRCVCAYLPCLMELFLGRLVWQWTAARYCLAAPDRRAAVVKQRGAKQIHGQQNGYLLVVAFLPWSPTVC